MGREFISDSRALVSSKASGDTVMEFPPTPDHTADEDGSGSVSIYDFPDYLDLKIFKHNSVLNIAKAPLYHGFSIDLSLFEDFGDYLQQMLNAKKRSNFKAVLRRFEQCIEPEYIVFKGEDLTKQECDTLILRLEEMLEVRFLQKREANYELPLMKFYRAVFHSLMLENKASLYVIYDRGRAISISMNLILGDTLMLFNSSYDNHYSPFGLGHINMMKNIEWAFDRGFQTVDLGRGDYTHKRRWVNKRYTYLEMKFGHEGSLLQWFKAITGISLLRSRFLVIQFLKFFGLQHVYSFLRKRLNRSVSESGGSARHSERAMILPVKDIDRTQLVSVDLFEPGFSDELASYLSILHKQRLSHRNLKPYLPENKPGQLYVEKEELFYQVVRNGEADQKK
jgi:hypothetical protein